MRSRSFSSPSRSRGLALGSAAARSTWFFPPRRAFRSIFPVQSSMLRHKSPISTAKYQLWNTSSSCSQRISPLLPG